jgi:hypothetical protein
MNSNQNKKGDIGENIIKEYLEKRGWIIYKPFTKDKAHFFDMLCTFEKQKVIAIDVKTKARLNKWNAQGINLRHYNEYLNFTNITNIPFYLIFVDDKLGTVHCAELKKMINPIFPNDDIIAWDLSQMQHMFNISNDQIKLLSEFDERNYIFKPL